MGEPDCDHLWTPAYCDRCGKYQGDECEFCGEWSDGGDHMASRDDLWCRCTAEDSSGLSDNEGA